jgi:hypothetical protein
MALIEATAFFKNHKEESKKIVAKYSHQNNPAYLEASYAIVAKLYDRIPLVTREGTEVQIKDALARKPGALALSTISWTIASCAKSRKAVIDKLYKKGMGWRWSVGVLGIGSPALHYPPYSSRMCHCCLRFL